MNSLAGAIGQLYPEQETAVVKEKARQVAAYFQIERFATKRELTKLSQMTAECAKVFPPDFASADPEEIIKQVKPASYPCNCFSICKKKLLFNLITVAPLTGSSDYFPTRVKVE